MAKLYLVIYLAGNLVGTVGPLPYNDTEVCRYRADRIMAQANHDVVTPEGYTTKDVRTECEFHVIRPQVN